MKTETKQKLVKQIDRLQNQIKGGPGSGPRPGGGGKHTHETAKQASAKAHEASIAAMGNPAGSRASRVALQNATGLFHRGSAEKHREAARQHVEYGEHQYGLRNHEAENRHYVAAGPHYAAAEAHESLIPKSSFGS